MYKAMCSSTRLLCVSDQGRSLDDARAHWKETHVGIRHDLGRAMSSSHLRGASNLRRYRQIGRRVRARVASTFTGRSRP
jgi:hypothetical protein